MRPASFSLFKIVAAAMLLLIPASLGGCSDTTSAVSVPRFSELMRGYDKTLTAEQRQAAIDDLKKEQAKQADAGKN